MDFVKNVKKDSMTILFAAMIRSCTLQEIE